MNEWFEGSSNVFGLSAEKGVSLGITFCCCSLECTDKSFEECDPVLLVLLSVFGTSSSLLCSKGKTGLKDVGAASSFGFIENETGAEKNIH